MVKASEQRWAVLRLLLLGLLPPLGWGCDLDDLEVEGKSAYVRCLMAGPPSARSWSVGSLRFALEGRTLRVDGAPQPLRLAVFSGPGLGAAPGAQAREALQRAAPHMAILLGAVGDTKEVAQATLAALSGLSFPSLVLAGARDSLARLDAAMQAKGVDPNRIIDITRLRVVRVGTDLLLPIAGGAQGRYAPAADGCGYAVDDLKQVLAELPADAEGRRYLLAWDVPGRGKGHAIGRTHLGVDVGSGHLEELSRRSGARGGLFAWPQVQLLRLGVAAGDRRLARGAVHSEARLVVPRIWGPAMERSDKTRVLPGFALVELSAHGLALVDTVALDVPP